VRTLSTVTVGKRPLTRKSTRTRVLHANADRPSAVRARLRWNQVYRSFISAPFPARAFLGSGPLLCNARFECRRSR